MARMSTNGVAALKVTVTVFVPGGGRLDVLGVVDRLADAGAARGRDGKLIDVAGRIGDRGDVGGRVVPADGQDVGVAQPPARSCRSP